MILPKYKVQAMGLEPTPGNPGMNLNHARMPIPPQVLTASSIVNQKSGFVKCFFEKIFKKFIFLIFSTNFIKKYR